MHDISFHPKGYLNARPYRVSLRIVLEKRWRRRTNYVYAFAAALLFSLLINLLTS